MTAACAFAQGHPNGNRLARLYTQGDAGAREKMRAESAGKVHTFRYLKVIALATNAPSNPSGITVLATEPSSDMEVEMPVSMRNSLALARTLEVGDHVAADGRIADLGKKTANRMILRPVRLNFKDRATPKDGPELLREVDPTAH